MLRRIECATLTVVVLAAAVAWPAAADQVLVSGTCEVSDRIPNSQWTTCGARVDATVKFYSRGPDTTYTATFTAPPEHCSAVNYQVWSLRDPNLMHGKTRRFLNAGESETFSIGNGFPRGNQNVAIRVLGLMGGCNEGRMESWAAAVNIMPTP